MTTTQPLMHGERIRSENQPGEWEYPVQQIGEFPTTLPTPQQAENDVLGATAGAVTMLKRWDLSPVDQSSFDPTEPPGRPVPPPTNTTPPVVTGTPIVGQVLTTSTGIWDGAPDTAAYQWLRGAGNRPGSATNSITLTAPDVGNLMSCRVTATNSTTGLSGVAVSNAVGPVTATAADPGDDADQLAPQPRRRR